MVDLLLCIIIRGCYSTLPSMLYQKYIYFFAAIQVFVWHFELLCHRFPLCILWGSLSRGTTTHSLTQTHPSTLSSCFALTIHLKWGFTKAIWKENESEEKKPRLFWCKGPQKSWAFTRHGPGLKAVDEYFSTAKSGIIFPFQICSCLKR